MSNQTISEAVKEAVRAIFLSPDKYEITRPHPFWKELPDTVTLSRKELQGIIQSAIDAKDDKICELIEETKITEPEGDVIGRVASLCSWVKLRKAELDAAAQSSQEAKLIKAISKANWLLSGRIDAGGGPEALLKWATAILHDRENKISLSGDAAARVEPTDKDLKMLLLRWLDLPPEPTGMGLAGSVSRESWIGSSNDLREETMKAIEKIDASLPATPTPQGQTSEEIGDIWRDLLPDEYPRLGDRFYNPEKRAWHIDELPPDYTKPASWPGWVTNTWQRRVNASLGAATDKEERFS